MSRYVALLMALGGAVLGCGDPGIIEPPPPPPPPPPPASLSVSSISPDYAFASSPDITVTINGSRFRRPGIVGRSQVLWRASSQSVVLATSFVSDTRLTAVVPATLLGDALSASLIVQDIVYDDGGDRTTDSDPVAFVVMPRDPSFSVAPTSAVAGSPDVTITVRGSGFHNRVNHQWTNVVLSVNGMDAWLTTTFVSSSELTAVIPAALLTQPLTAVVSVWTGDPMGDIGGARAGGATFAVTP